MTEQMMSVREVAEYLNLSENTVYRLKDKKDGIRAYKVGGLIRFRRSEVETYIESKAVKCPEKEQVFPGMARFRYKPGMKVVQAGR